MPWLACIKKPSARPVLRGTDLAHEHLDPVEILPDGVDFWSMKADGTFTHFAWQRVGPLLQSVRKEVLRADETSIGGVLNTVRQKVYTLDRGLYTPAQLASFEDRDAVSVIETERSIGTVLKLKAAKVIVVR